MDDARSESPDGSRTEEFPGGAERPSQGGETRDGEHRTTVEAETARLRAAEKAQAEHPDFIGLRGRATGEPPLTAAEETADPRDPTT